MPHASTSVLPNIVEKFEDAFGLPNDAADEEVLTATNTTFGGITVTPSGSITAAGSTTATAFSIDFTSFTPDSGEIWVVEALDGTTLLQVGDETVASQSKSDLLDTIAGEIDGEGSRR